MSLLDLLDYIKPIDAARPDDSFFAKFVFHSKLPLILRDDCAIITGEKGSGKTAVCVYLNRELSSDSTVVLGIAFNDLRHADITRQISELSRLTGVDSIAMTSGFWRSVIMIEAMKCCFIADQSNLTVHETQIVGFLRETGHMTRTPIDTFLHLVVSAWRTIDKITSGTAPDVAEAMLEYIAEDGTTRSIKKNAFEYLKRYPFSENRYLKAESNFLKYLENKNKRIVFHLDGFDKLRGDGPSATKSLDKIFEGLIDCVYNVKLEKNWSEKFLIKALIPHDRWLAIHQRDRDKYRDVHQCIIWKYTDLKSFVHRRFSLHSKAHNTLDFDSSWSIFLPDSVRNSFYGNSEHLFDYILRHTQYRPRQLQHHLIKICETFQNNPIIPEMIPEIIASSCKERVHDFEEEFIIDHPRIREFLLKFRGCSTVVTYTEFYSWVSKALKQLNESNVDVRLKIEKLYQIGFVGLVKFIEDHEFDKKKMLYYFPSKRVDGKRYKCEFYYEDTAPETFIDLRDDDLVCFHPMFHDYCSLTAHQSILIG